MGPSKNMAKEETVLTPVEKLKKEAFGNIIIIAVGGVLIAVGIGLAFVGVSALTKKWKAIKELETKHG